MTGVRKTGVCMMCATESDTVQPYKFGQNFTSHAELAAGDGLCAACADMIADKNSRKSWIMEAGKRAVLDRNEWIPTIMRDKTPPFMLYLTPTGKTQGFIPLMRRPNTNNHTYVLAYERDVIRVDRDSIPGLLDTADYLRKRKWSKAEMTGEPITDRYADETAIRRWNKARTNPAWPVIVGGLASLPAREAKT